MGGIASAVLPVALGGALLAGISYPGGGRLVWSGGRRRGERRGRPLGRSPRSPRAAGGGGPASAVRPAPARRAPGRPRSGVAAEPAQSLVVVGPTQSGKTTSLAVPAILGWRGPVVAASVKSDLLRHTLGVRARGVACGASTPPGAAACRRTRGHRSSVAATGVEPARWRRISARRPRQTARRRTASSGTPRPPSSWPPCSCAAALDRRTMADVVRWVDTQEVGEVAGILEAGAAPPRRSMQPGPPGAATSGRAAPSTRRPRRCSPPSPTPPRRRRRPTRSSRAPCSAHRTRSTCARPRTTSDGCAATSRR